MHYSIYPVGEDACPLSAAVDWKPYDALLCGCVSNRCTVFKL
jgi:hypothetical protein